MSATAPASDEMLKNFLQSLIVREFADNGKVLEISIEQCRAVSSYNVDIVTAKMQNRRQYRVFRKDFGYSRRPKVSFQRRRDREMRVYRDLLSSCELGTPRYLGAIWEDHPTINWLFLEFVDGIEVRYMEKPFWFAAAGWLGRLQASFADRTKGLADCDYLEQHDTDFFVNVLRRARAAVEHLSPEDRSVFERIARRFEQAIPLMADQPRTLVHGAYRPQNLLVRRCEGNSLICPTDWERGAFGSTVFDFACFADGFRDEDLRRLWSEYRSSASSGGYHVGDLSDVMEVIDSFRLYRVVNWLSMSVERAYSTRDVGRLLEVGSQLATH